MLLPFGIALKNKVFNKLSDTAKNVYLTTRYKEDSQTKEKDYSMLIDDLNNLVEKEVNNGREFYYFLT